MKKIILIEDDKNIIDLYRTAFESKTNYDVELACTSKEIKRELEQIKKGESVKPDLMLLDLMLPDANGIEILKIAKKEQALKDIPIFVLTNYENPDLEKELDKEKIWPEKYLIKVHHTPLELIEIIKKYFDKTEKDGSVKLA